MIRVELAPEPPDFDEVVRLPGRAWLEKNLQEGKKNLPDYWSRVARELRQTYNDRCAYTAMWLSASGTVDHFVSRNEDPRLAYEWSNFRYAAGWFNSSKSALRAEQVLDPFEIGDDWFEILLPSCQLIMTENCPPEFRERAQTMLKRLKLRDGEKVIEVRQEWYRMYREDQLSSEELARKAPLIARAVRRREEASARAASPVADPSSEPARSSPER